MKRRLIFFLTLSLLMFVGCLDKSKLKKHEKNHLGNEKSPYLQQHAKNPIWWYPWGAQASFGN